jgi:hypothetical protein
MQRWCASGVSGVVCASIWAIVLTATGAQAGTIPVPAGGDLQAALDAAQGGDVITLEPGALYVGNFILRDKPGMTQPIVIRSAAPDSQLPLPGVRMTPAYASLLPRIKSPNSMPAMRTAAGAHHWTLLFLEFQANQNGYGDIIALGAGDSTQTDLLQVPYALTLDRLYVHGDPLLGQKRGIALHSRDTSILNSHVSDCKAVGQDSQAIGGFNGPGNYLIENNYLEGAAENFMLGGADPTIQNLVPSNVVIRRNHFRKPLEWRDSIVPAPIGVAATAVTGGASLPPGTYYYKVVARRMAGATNRASSSPSIEVLATVGDGGAVTVSWSSVEGAQDYLVYGRTAGAQNMYWQTTGTVFTDTGAAGISGIPVKATKWSVKNILEVKSGQDILIEGNVFENLWIADQAGYAITLTPRNQGGRAPWTVVQRITFRNNLVRHTAGGVSILGYDNLQPSLRTNRITIENNLFDDMTSATWGSGSRFLMLGGGPDSITVDHNTVMTTTSAVVWLYGGSTTSPTPITNVTYTNNMSRHNSYGIMGSGYSIGLSSINAYMPDAIVTHGVLAGGKASNYPAGNFFPTTTEWEAQFVDYAGGDYRLKPASVFRNAGADGADVGANIDLLLEETRNALTGDNRAAGAGVQILTTALPDGVRHQPYSATLSCSSPSGACTWALTAGVLPQGLAFDPATAAIAGTPSGVEQQTVTFEAYDVSSPTLTATRAFSMTIAAPPFTMSFPPAPNGRVGVAYQLSPTVSGAIGSVTWSVVSGSLPPGLTIDAVSGAISGTPTLWGTPTAVVSAVDSGATERRDEEAVTISIAPTPLQIGTTPPPSGRYGTAYAAQLIASGGTGSAAWSIAAGALPAGITLDAGGLLSGVPAAVGSFAFTVQATDANWPDDTSSAQFTLTIDAPPPGATTHIGDLAGSSVSVKKGSWTATVTITVHDENHQPVASTAVTGAWSGSYAEAASCTTDAAGRCSVTTGPIGNAGRSAAFTVSGVSHVSQTYVPAANHDSSGDSSGTAITVRKP